MLASSCLKVPDLNDRGSNSFVADYLILSLRVEKELFLYEVVLLEETEFLELISEKNGALSESDRKRFATKAFNVSSHYDSAIFNYFNKDGEVTSLKLSENNGKVLRYGENPHQKGRFIGDLKDFLIQLNGKEISYNFVNTNLF